MPLSKEQFNKLAKQAANDYARKLKLESPLNKELNSFFNDLTKSYEDYYTKHGAAMGLNEYQKELESILNDHHIKTASTFSSNLRNIAGNPNNNDVMQRKLDANIRGYAAQRAHLMSHNIIDTTRGNIETVTRKAEVDAALAEKPLSNAEIANIATNNLNSKLINRAPIISTTETQVGAETGKSLEYETMVDMDSEIDGDPVKEMAQKKVWITMLDDHTRAAHAEADAQEVDIDEPFEVDGEELMMPGDDSLGASEENLINCRCAMEYIVD